MTKKAKSPMPPEWLAANQVMVRFGDWMLRGKPPRKVAESVSVWANNSLMSVQAFGKERKTVMMTRDEARTIFPFVAAEFTPINSITQTAGEPLLSYWVDRKKKK